EHALGALPPAWREAHETDVLAVGVTEIREPAADLDHRAAMDAQRLGIVQWTREARVPEPAPMNVVHDCDVVAGTQERLHCAAVIRDVAVRDDAGRAPQPGARGDERRDHCRAAPGG